MEEVDAFIESSKDSKVNVVKTFEIKSESLKKSLAREINNKYKILGVIWTDFKKGQDQFTLKRWAKKTNNNQGKKQPNPEDSKKQEPSTGDEIIKVSQESITDEVSTQSSIMEPIISPEQAKEEDK